MSVIIRRIEADLLQLLPRRLLDLDRTAKFGLKELALLLWLVGSPSCSAKGASTFTSTEK
jgi:hypothetical protein